MAQKLKVYCFSNESRIKLDVLKKYDRLHVTLSMVDKYRFSIDDGIPLTFWVLKLY